MDYNDLIDSLLSKIWIIILSIISINILYIPIYKRCVNGLLDPLLIGLVFSSLANSVPFYLFSVGLMRLELLLFIILSEFSFWGVFYNTHVRLKYKYSKPSDDSFIEKIGLLSLLMVVVLQLCIYKLNGIPLFNESRFAATGGNDTIVNLLQRLISPFMIFLCLYCFKKMEQRRRKGFYFFFIILIISFLSGSKSFILSLVSGYFFYNFFYKGITPHLRWYIIFIIILTPLITLYNKSDNALGAYLYRLIGNGDIYWNAVYNDAIDYVKIDNPFINQTHLFWGPFRYLIGFKPGPNDMAIVGESIMEYAYSHVSGVPNSRIPVLGWIYFRWFGLLFSAFMGWISAYFIKKVPNMYNGNMISVFYKCSFYSIGVSFITDGYLGFSSLLSILFFSIVVGFVRLINQINRDGKIVNYNNQL